MATLLAVTSFSSSPLSDLKCYFVTGSWAFYQRRKKLCITLHLIIFVCRLEFIHSELQGILKNKGRSLQPLCNCLTIAKFETALQPDSGCKFCNRNSVAKRLQFESKIKKKYLQSQLSLYRLYFVVSKRQFFDQWRVF